jgi:glycine/D-amino acid oxidase-like deaminating enzyme
VRIGFVKQPERVAVIGVGILGASVGWNLSRHGAKVIFIDAGQPGEGVTNWSFSWVNASNKTARKSYFDLNVASMAAYRELAETIGPDPWWFPSGHLRWADDPAAQAKLLKTAELLTGWDYRVEVCTGAEVRRRLEPALTMPDEVPVVSYPDEAWVHGRHLVGRLVGQAVTSGAEHRSGTAVCDIGTGADGSIRTVALSDGSRLDVDIVVNAAGPSASTSPGSSHGTCRCAGNPAPSPGSAALGSRSTGPCTRLTSRSVLTETLGSSSTAARSTHSSTRAKIQRNSHGCSTNRRGTSFPNSVVPASHRHG